MHAEIISVQISGGKTEGTKSHSYSEPFKKKSQEQRVNLLFTCNSSQMTFLPQFFSNRKQFLPADLLKFFWVPDFFHQQAAVCPVTALLTLLGLIKLHSLRVALKFIPTMNVMECSGFSHLSSVPSWFLFSTLHYLNDLFLCFITCSSIAPVSCHTKPSALPPTRSSNPTSQGDYSLACDIQLS